MLLSVIFLSCFFLSCIFSMPWAWRLIIIIIIFIVRESATCRVELFVMSRGACSVSVCVVRNTISFNYRYFQTSTSVAYFATCAWTGGARISSVCSAVSVTRDTRSTRLEVTVRTWTSVRTQTTVCTARASTDLEDTFAGARLTTSSTLPALAALVCIRIRIGMQMFNVQSKTDRKSVLSTARTKLIRLTEKLKRKPLSSTESVKAVRRNGCGLWWEGFEEKVPFEFRVENSMEWSVPSSPL